MQEPLPATNYQQNSSGRMRGKRSEPHRRTCGGLKRARSIETRPRGHLV